MKNNTGNFILKKLTPREGRYIESYFIEIIFRDANKVINKRCEIKNLLDHISKADQANANLKQQTNELGKLLKTCILKVFKRSRLQIFDGNSRRLIDLDQYIINHCCLNIHTITIQRNALTEFENQLDQFQVDYVKNTIGSTL